jgi:hypothetical protein
MPELIAHVMTEPGADPARASDELREQLSELAGPEQVTVEVERPQLGLPEILTIVQIAKGAVDVIKALIDFIDQHREHVKGIEVEIDGERVPIDKLTAEQRAALEAALAG